MNGHRTALAALLTASRDERSRAAGPNGTYEERARLDDRIAALDAALTAGDEAEAEDDDEPEGEVLTPAQAVEAHLTLRALRRSLARALGRRTISRVLLGDPVDVEPPSDGVMLSEVEDLRRKATGTRDVVLGVRKALDLPHGVLDAEIPDLVAEAHKASEAVVRERRNHEQHVVDLRALIATETGRRDRLAYALHTLVGIEHADRLPDRDLLLRVADQAVTPDQIDRALAAFDGAATANTDTAED
jgi:hypothetical protein